MTILVRPLVTRLSCSHLKGHSLCALLRSLSSHHPSPQGLSVEFELSNVVLRRPHQPSTDSANALCGTERGRSRARPWVGPISASRIRLTNAGGFVRDGEVGGDPTTEALRKRPSSQTSRITQSVNSTSGKRIKARRSGGRLSAFLPQGKKLAGRFPEKRNLAPRGRSASWPRGELGQMPAAVLSARL